MVVVVAWLPLYIYGWRKTARASSGGGCHILRSITKVETFLFHWTGSMDDDSLELMRWWCGDFCWISNNVNLILGFSWQSRPCIVINASFPGITIIQFCVCLANNYSWSALVALSASATCYCEKKRADTISRQIFYSTSMKLITAMEFSRSDGVPHRIVTFVQKVSDNLSSSIVCSCGGGGSWTVVCWMNVTRARARGKIHLL